MDFVAAHYFATEILRATSGPESLSEKHQNQKMRIAEVKAEYEASPSITGEIKIALQIVIQAVLNPVYAKSEEDCDELTEMKEPCTVLNADGEILVWYIPDCLVQERLNQLFNSVKDARNSWLQPTKKKGDSRNKEDDLYLNLRNKIASGSVDLSPSWYPQGHEGLDEFLCPSRTMRNRNAADFIEGMADHMELVDAIFSVIHKKLHAVAGTVMEEMKSRFSGCPAVQYWNSVFTGMSIITNRLTKDHVDSKAGKFYDMLTSAGLHDTAHLDTPKLGYTFRYPPGTIIAICASTVKHGVRIWKGFDRICLVHFIRYRLLKHYEPDSSNLGVPKADSFQEMMDPQFVQSEKRNLWKV